MRSTSWRCAAFWSSRATRWSVSSRRSWAWTASSSTFTKEALIAIAIRAQSRKTGARGLRSILEEVMLDVMYDLPSLQGVKKCVINKEVDREARTADAHLRGSTQRPVRLGAAGTIHTRRRVRALARAISETGSV